MILERCREVRDEPRMVVGEKAATVGNWLSSCKPWSCEYDEAAMESIHGSSSGITSSARKDWRR